MKRWIIYILLLATALFMPVRGTDVARLRPVQIVYLSRHGNQVYLQTDTGDVGQGASAVAALENLKDTAPAVIYLDTAKYLLVTREAEEDVESLRSRLKESVSICRAEGAVMKEETADFLAVHRQLPQLKHWKPGMYLPLLTEMENRLILMKKSEENA